MCVGSGYSEGDNSEGFGEIVGYDCFFLNSWVGIVWFVDVLFCFVLCCV